MNYAIEQSSLFPISRTKGTEALTPHKVTVILLINKYSFIHHKSRDSAQRGEQIPEPLTAKQRKDTGYLIAKLIQGSDLHFSQLQQRLRTAQLCHHHYTAFMLALQQMHSEGIDRLMMLFEAVDKFTSEEQTFPCFWTSIVGLHLRQMNLAFKRLSFSQVATLYDQFHEYCQDAFPPVSQANAPSLLKEAPEASSTLDSSVTMADLDEANVDLTYHPTPDMSMSMPDMLPESPVLPTLPADLLQLPPGLEEAEVENEEETNYHTPSVPSPAWSEGSRQQAELFISQQTALLEFNEAKAASPAVLHANIDEILHHNPHMAEAHFLRYLNWLRVGELRGAVDSLVSSYDCQLLQPQRGADAPRTLRYAALNMAALHARFGHKKVALRGIQEAVQLAQESSDNVCLQHTLSWLYILSPVHKKAALMKRSLHKTEEMALPYLSGLSLLNLVSLQAQSLIAPNTILQSLLGEQCRSSNSSSSVGAGSEQSLARPIGLWGVEAAIWASWGSEHMMVLCSQLVLHNPAQLATAPGTPHGSSHICAALCNMALTLANRGDHSAAERILCYTREQFPCHSRHAHYWQLAQANISFTDHLLQAAWAQAQSLLPTIAAYSPLQAKYKTCVLLVCKGECESALQKLSPLLAEAQEDPHLLVQCSLLKGEALASGSCYSTALAALLQARDLATQHHFALLAALTALHLAAVQLQLGLVSEAQQSVHAGLDVVLTAGSVLDQARALLIHAKLQVRMAQSTNDRCKLSAAALSLDRVIQMFQKVRAHHRVRDVVYLKARLYHELGQAEERNQCALEFRQLEQQQPCQSILPTIPIF